MNDQLIKLIFETLGTEGVNALRAALVAVNQEGPAVESALNQVSAAEAKTEKDTYELVDAVKDLEDAYQLMVVPLKQYAQTAGPGLDPVALAMAELSERAELAAEKVAKATQAVSAHASGQGQLQQRLTAASYAFQDFASATGDLGQKLNSITNNIPGMLTGLGNFATVISVAVVAGVSLYRNWDTIAGLFESRRPFPQQTEDLELLNAQLKANEKALDALREKGTLNNTQMEEANRLIAQQTDLEEKLDQERKTRAYEKRLAPGMDEFTKDIGAGVEKAIMSQGGYKAVIDRLTELTMKTDPTATEAGRAGFRRAAEEMVNKALQGDAKMRDTMIWLGEQMDKTGITGTLGAELRRLSPEKTKWTAAQAEALIKQGAEYEKPAMEELKRSQAEQKQDRDFDEEARKTYTRLNREERKKAQKSEAEAFDIQAEADYKKIEAEKKRIERTVGAPMQRQFEMMMAANAANLAAGMGGMDPARLSQQLQFQMYEEMKRRGATGGAALGAARGIAAKGEENLGRRAADASQTNLSIAGQTLAISRQLIGEYARMNTTQQELVREAKAQQQAIKASTRTRLAR